MRATVGGHAMKRAITALKRFTTNERPNHPELSFIHGIADDGKVTLWALDGYRAAEVAFDAESIEPGEFWINPRIPMSFNPALPYVIEADDAKTHISGPFGGTTHVNCKSAFTDLRALLDVGQGRRVKVNPSLLVSAVQAVKCGPRCHTDIVIPDDPQKPVLLKSKESGIDIRCIVLQMRSYGGDE